MLPISFERHCKECHPLSVQLAGRLERTDCATAPASSAASRASSRLPGRRPRRCRAGLRERLTRFILRPPNKPFLSGAEAGRAASDRCRGGARSSRCRRRNSPGSIGSSNRWSTSCSTAAAAAATATKRKPLPRSGPVGCPSTSDRDCWAWTKPWYEHSVFSHGSHKMLDCTECHDARASNNGQRRADAAHRNMPAVPQRRGSRRTQRLRGVPHLPRPQAKT